MEMGRCSLAASCAKAGELAGVRMVASTLCPARANASADANPIPLLQPVIRIVATMDTCLQKNGRGVAALKTGPVKRGDHTNCDPVNTSALGMALAAAAFITQGIDASLCPPRAAAVRARSRKCRAKRYRPATAPGSWNEAMYRETTRW